MKSQINCQIKRELEIPGNNQLQLLGCELSAAGDLQMGDADAAVVVVTTLKKLAKS